MQTSVCAKALKKAGVQPSDLVGIYSALIRSVLEYAVCVVGPSCLSFRCVRSSSEEGDAHYLSAGRFSITWPFAVLGSDPSLTAAMPFALNLYRRLGHHLLSAIFSRTGSLLSMAINCVQVSSAMSKLKATLRDLIIL